MLTNQQLQAALPGYKHVSAVVDFVNQQLQSNKIITNKQIAMFLAQTGYESANWTVTDENLQYSAEALLRVWPSHFANYTEAEQYAYQPEKIANRVYANRMGNGNEASGDGWLYHGRGIIQITGKDNYTAFAAYCNIALSDIISYIEKDLTGDISAGFWFWAANNLRNLTTVYDVTEAINGGQNGAAVRSSEYNRILKILDTPS